MEIIDGYCDKSERIYTYEDVLQYRKDFEKMYNDFYKSSKLDATLELGTMENIISSIRNAPKGSYKNIIAKDSLWDGGKSEKVALSSYYLGLANLLYIRKVKSDSNQIKAQLEYLFREHFMYRNLLFDRVGSLDDFYSYKTSLTCDSFNSYNEDLVTLMAIFYLKEYYYGRIDDDNIASLFLQFIQKAISFDEFCFYILDREEYKYKCYRLKGSRLVLLRTKRANKETLSWLEDLYKQLSSN